MTRSLAVLALLASSLPAVAQYRYGQTITQGNVTLTILPGRQLVPEDDSNAVLKLRSTDPRTVGFCVTAAFRVGSQVILKTFYEMKDRRRPMFGSFVFIYLENPLEFLADIRSVEELAVTSRQPFPVN